ncbi:MAG: thiamine pyrophosphate-dependent enzyme, partial [Rhodospirillales bacterium]|nr:thiamine pyrophosphate-dependent enzyme [Rhodospirillales bacterium]
MAKSNDSIFTGANAAYIAELYDRYLADPNSVDTSWVPVFKELEDNKPGIEGEINGASWARSKTSVIGQDGGGNGIDEPTSIPTEAKSQISSDEVTKVAQESIRARILIRSYRVRGHLHAQFDPLGIIGAGYHRELDYKTYGFTEEDLNRKFFLDTFTSMAGKAEATLGEILEVMRESYCSSIGVEYMHIQETEERAWIQNAVEGYNYRTEFSPRLKKMIFKDLIEAEGFENFLQVKHTGTKRFGLDGGESMIPCIERMLRTAAYVGIKEVVIGMPHRGRLNVLARTMSKPHRAIFSEFQGGVSTPEDVQGSGDVKYHLGASADRKFTEGIVHLSLTANPSHLEAVNPVVLGKVRAKQHQRGDNERSEVMGLLLHGDAAFAGQGIVPESLDLSKIKGYKTGGTIHLVVNNQIGFTTNPAHSRSTPYPTDIAKGMQVPIFHVNGDDPEAVIFAVELAHRYRMHFHKDVVIDIICYRRLGHNEADE